jgi:hypothetical protein
VALIPVLVRSRNLRLLCVWALFLSVYVSAQAQSPSAIGELFPTEEDAHGAALLTGTGMSVASGSQLSAGQSVAALILTRGGQVRICPQSSLSVTAVPNTEGLLFALDTGSLEINYPINALADTLLTPDFKLLLAGPGTFHFALGVNNRGDTCIRSLGGNTSGIIVTETMGTGTYQIKPDEKVLFSKGKLTDRSSDRVACGCPAPPPPVPRAQQSPETGATAELPPQKRDDVQVKVDVPLVFRASAEGAASEPEPSYTVAKVRFSTLPDIFFLQEEVQPSVLEKTEPKKAPGEVSPKKNEKKGFLGRIKGFFASIFHS